jgi:hypothetical protein
VAAGYSRGRTPRLATQKAIGGYLSAGGRFDAIGVSAWPMQSHGDHAALQAPVRNGRVTLYQED